MMVCSSMAAHMPISCNYTKGRTHSIDNITIHHMAGNLSLKQCHGLFDRNGRRASSNYAIDADGNVACYVGEEDTSWCSSSTANDCRSITIELANDGGAPEWHVSDKTVAALKMLLVDICARNGIPALLWWNDKSKALQTDVQNMTIHRWFKNKVCPGAYVEANLKYIARDVNQIIGAKGFYYAVRLCGDITNAKIAAAAAGYTPYKKTEFGKEVWYVGKFCTTQTYHKMVEKIRASGFPADTHFSYHPTWGCKRG